VEENIPVSFVCHRLIIGRNTLTSSDDRTRGGPPFMTFLKISQYFPTLVPSSWIKLRSAVFCLVPAR